MIRQLTMTLCSAMIEHCYQAAKAGQRYRVTSLLFRALQGGVADLQRLISLHGPVRILVVILWMAVNWPCRTVTCHHCIDPEDSPSAGHVVSCRVGLVGLVGRGSVVRDLVVITLMSFDVAASRGHAMDSPNYGMLVRPAAQPGRPRRHTNRGCMVIWSLWWTVNSRNGSYRRLKAVVHRSRGHMMLRACMESRVLYYWTNGQCLVHCERLPSQWARCWVTTWSMLWNIHTLS